MSQFHNTIGLTAEHLRLFLNFLPKFWAECDEIRKDITKDKAEFINDASEPVSWCYLYELPIKQHLTVAITRSAQCYQGFLAPELIVDWLKQLVATPGQVGALPYIYQQVNHHMDGIELSKAEAEQVRPALAQVMGYGFSIYHSLNCVMYFGCFLNDLIEEVRQGNDQALFNAIRIDRTVLGCPTVVERISQAALFQEETFFSKLKAAMNQKLNKREQANFQKMRMVCEVLMEAGASRLSDEQLRQLFVDELGLYAWDEKNGGNIAALRKFADTYMRNHATT